MIWNRPHHPKLFRLGPLCVLIAALAACGVPPEEKWPHLRLLVANEAKAYANGIEDSLKDYKERGGIIVTVERAPEAEIAARLAQPNPPDLVMVSNPALVAALAGRKLIEPVKWRLERVRDQIVLAAAKDSPLRAESLKDLTRPEFKAIGLTDPMHSHVGQIAELQLVRQELSRALDPRIKRFADQESLVRAIESGAVQAGLIRLSSLKGDFSGRVRPLLTFDPAAGRYPPYAALAVCCVTKQPIAAHNTWGFLEMWLRNPEMFMIDADGGGNLFKLNNMAQ